MDVFPAFWDRLEELIVSHEVIATEVVLDELAKKDDEVHAWVKARPALFRTVDEEIQIRVRAILKDYRYLVKETASQTQADPFVIALAQGENLIVVTEEHYGSASKPKIPFVCDKLGIPHTNTVGMLRRLGLSFKT